MCFIKSVESSEVRALCSRSIDCVVVILSNNIIKGYTSARQMGILFSDKIIKVMMNW